MKIHEQVEEMRSLLADIVEELTLFRCSVIRKCAARYPDGSTSTMVNADTDVLPRLEQLRQSVWDFQCRTGIVLPSTLED